MFSLAQFGINEEKKSCFRKKNYLVFRSNNHQFVCNVKCLCLFDKGKFISTECDWNRLIASMRTNDTGTSN